jgi:Dolichyl-phosphate-mannose-protein mannosyltransferase
VPLLAFGCYGVGSIVAGRTAGLLAAVFALGSPMFVSMMHQYDLDPPQAAMVAVTVWALLAGERFRNLGLSLVAGLCCGLALLTKQTSFIFLAGPLVVLVLRGGWRNWRGVLLFALATALVAGPWYAIHIRDLERTFSSIAELAPNPVQAPPRFSFANAGWYFWDLVNEQTLAPFALLFLIGVVAAVVRLIRDPWLRGGYLPELLAGALVSYLGMTYLTHKDPRYTLPALLYVAVLATFWIPALSRPWLRRAFVAAVAIVAIVNFVGVSFGIGGVADRAMVSLPGAQTSIVWPGRFTLYEDMGYVRGGPIHNGDVLALIRGLRAEGVKWVAVDPRTNYVDFSPSGLLPLLDEEGIRYTSKPLALSDARYLLAQNARPGDPRPCQWITGSGGVFEERPGVRLGIYVLDAPGNMSGGRTTAWRARGSSARCPKPVS